MNKNEKGEVVLTEQELEKFAQDTAKATTDALVEEFKLDKPAAPTIISADVSQGAEQRKWRKTVEYFQALGNRDIAKLKALNEGTTTAGGFLVPTEFSDQLIATLEQYGSARRNSTNVRMMSKTLNLNSLTGKVTAYWVDEANAITASQPTFGEPILTAKKLGGLTPWSSEIFEDSEINLIDNLVTLYVEAFSGEEDNQFFNGTGSPFTGVLKVSGTVATTLDGPAVAGNITYAKAVDITHSLSQGQLAGAAPKWFMSRTVKAEFAKVVDQNGNPILNDGRGSIPPTILGYEVELNEKLPAASSVGASAAFAAFGNLKPWCYFGDRRQVTSKILDEGTVGSDNLGEKDMEALRVIERVSELVAIAANIAVLKTSA